MSWFRHKEMVEWLDGFGGGDETQKKLYKILGI